MSVMYSGNQNKASLKVESIQMLYKCFLSIGFNFFFLTKNSFQIVASLVMTCYIS